MLARIVIIFIIIIIIIIATDIVISPLSLPFRFLLPSPSPPSSRSPIQSTISFTRARALALSQATAYSSWLAISLLEIIYFCLSSVFPDRIFPPSLSLSRVLCLSHTTFLLPFRLPPALSFRMLARSFSRQFDRIPKSSPTKSLALSFSLIHACTHPFVPYEKDCKPITHNSLLLFIIIISYS